MKQIGLWSDIPLVAVPMSDETAAAFYRGLARREGMQAGVGALCLAAVSFPFILADHLGVSRMGLMGAGFAAWFALYGLCSHLFARRPWSGAFAHRLTPISNASLEALAQRAQVDLGLANILREWLETGHPIRADQERFLLDKIEKKEREQTAQAFVQASVQ